ncbi:MalT-like TPR region domain-containing protein [Plasmodiophora brassicae]|uniref:MalT-like TPR region domain-containing protein n=1 Tax=Plasmodiophora brassicae TaxID=37360 RepID=A0A0G4J4E4_PLABS|nr:hypothetical protein PBRA_009097 [Plasmodiophora brassicae]SPR01726.1 unnamed protein product [Plasmodiophora brassicae]
MSSHSKSGAIIGLDSSMGFNHAAVMFGGHHAAKRRSRPSLQGGERRRRSPSPSSKRANGRHPDADVDVEPVDMTPPEERLTNHAVRCVGYEEAHDFDNLVLGRTHCLALAQLCFGKLHPEVTLAHCRLAHAYLRKGLFPQAEGHAQAALERLDQCDHGTSADPIRFSALATLGQAYVGQRQFAKAEPHLNKATLLPAPTPAEKCDLLVAIAAVQTNKRFYGDAATTLETAVGEKLKSVSETHPDMLAMFLALGRVYLKLASSLNDAGGALVGKAVATLTRAVNVGVANEVVYRQEMGDALFHLGVALAETDSPTASIDNFERALKIYRNLHGRQSSQVARTLRQIASLFVKLRNVDSAIQYLAMTIKAESRLHGPNSLQVADLIKTRGDVETLGSRFQVAVASFQEAETIYETLQGSESAQAAECRERILRTRELQASHAAAADKQH